MALIKCEECGAMVSEKATTCPKCGAPIEQKVTCSECGFLMPAHEKACPNCGCPNDNQTKKTDTVARPLNPHPPTQKTWTKKSSVFW